MRLFLFFTSKTQNVWCVARSVICLLGYYRKNPNRWGERGGRSWGHTFLNKNPGVFRFGTLPLDILDKTKLYPWKFRKIVLHPFENPRSKTKVHGNSTFFLDHTWRFHFFFNWPLEFPQDISSVPLEVPCPIACNTWIVCFIIFLLIRDAF